MEADKKGLEVEHTTRREMEILLSSDDVRGLAYWPENATGNVAIVLSKVQLEDVIYWLRGARKDEGRKKEFIKDLEQLRKAVWGGGVE